MIDIAELLPRALVACGGTGKALAEALGVPESTISIWRNGKTAPSLPSLLKLAVLTGDDPGDVARAHMEMLRRRRAA